MAELIDREALLKSMNPQYNKDKTDVDDEASFAEGFVSVERLIKDQPAVEAAPVVHGERKICSDGYYPYCSHCTKEPKNGVMSDYCPNCSARMRGGNE